MAHIYSFADFAPSADHERIARLLETLVHRYADPKRYYHNLWHIADGLEQQERLQPKKPLRDVEFFAWVFHDAVYDPTRSDNEELSASLFMENRDLIGLNMDKADEVVSLILDTTHTGRINLITDMDLCGFGTPPERFDANSRAIRGEYAFVPEEAWRKGRAAILEYFLNRPRLYHTNEFAAAFTVQARENLQREIFELQSI